MNNHVVSIRQAELMDLDAIMPLFDAARSFMAKNGNPNQWINGYPERELIESEILQGNCYVCEDKVAECCAYPSIFKRGIQYVFSIQDGNRHGDGFGNRCFCDD